MKRCTNEGNKCASYIIVHKCIVPLSIVSFDNQNMVLFNIVETVIGLTGIKICLSQFGKFYLYKRSSKANIFSVQL